ncbi:LysR family transcriptional regulator [Lysobacter capsici]|uniref:LysR family transcriptional regulator n=1 Tax=Lysobacter capsici TaxID=435897 RepID=UPI00287B6B23|nr:LysR family transcriptional regulator [Lysobacter capsici]WND81298.1 LysR family transcriptional regulator [Lysobacter capsici]WND86494.1 LysR family transcriptional regulator [Lysobacter capsici]
MRQARLSLEDFELLRAIGAHGSLSGAAKALALDHSSAFRRLAAIEARAGAALFRRSRSGYVATEAGAVAIAGAQRILDDADRLQRQLAGRDAQAQGRLRITIPDTLAAVAARMCAAFSRQHPSVRCDLIVANAFVNLQQPDADVALRASALMPDGLSVRRIASISTAVYVASGAKVGKRSGLAEGDWIGFDDALSHLSSAHWLRAHVGDERIAMRVNSLPAALAACQAGIGRALLPCYYADAAGGVKRLSGPMAEVPTELWFAVHPDLRRSAKVKLLREFAMGWLPARVEVG